MFRSFHVRLENKLNMLIEEVRSGKRDGSIISVASVDSIVQNDHATWESLKRELEDVGISTAVINEQRQFIIAWFQEAVARGQLEEDTPDESINRENPHSSDRDAAVNYDQNSYSSSSWSGSSASEEIENNGASIRREPQQRADRSLATPSSQITSNQKSRLSISYLLRKLQSKDRLLIKALKSHDAEEAILLLEQGASADIRDSFFTTPLHYAASYNIASLIGPLLDKGADMQVMNGKGDTPLHLACSRGSVDIATALMSKGARIEAKNANGYTPLHKAGT